MIKIGGTTLPSVVSYQVSIQDISKADRNANGTMIIERIATKRKIELAFEYLTKSQYQQVLNLVSPVFFNVEYPDPQTGNIRTGTFYCGDRTIQGLDFYKGEMRWKGLNFNLVER